MRLSSRPSPPTFPTPCPIPQHTRTMATISFADGNAIPKIGFGTGSALFKKDCAASVTLAIQSGFTHLDCAQAYENEAALAAGLKASGKARSEVFITTKLRPGTAAAKVKESVVESLQKLGVDQVDLFLIHAPRPLVEGDTLPSLWAAVEAIQTEGLAKNVGVSNFTADDLKAIVPTAKILPAANQIELHPYVYKAAEPILAYAQEKGIKIESYGGLTPLVRAPGGPVDEVLARIISRLGGSVTSAQVLTKWLWQKGAVVVTTSSKEDRLKEYLASADVSDLTAEEIKAIDEAGAKLHKRVFMAHVFGE
ncbi:unnamed protein product [Mycena citricolor]|uniref:NADP-dependent oxidoreductase domain-containing protein n=1 Tax=Mycena citricolor TaxID=2018698 RepID=A0AAD2H4P3_9AGAR|nr:unnamed protein product [Mycena citricolor]